MMMKSVLPFVGFIFCLSLMLKKTGAFEFEDYGYDLVQNAVLVFGAPTPTNLVMIQKLASKNFTVMTWTKTKPYGTYLHPIITTNEKGENYVNCLFNNPNYNATLITNYYMTKMLSSTKTAKLVLLISLESHKINNGFLTNQLEWIVKILPDLDRFGNSIFFLATEGDAEAFPTLDRLLDLLSQSFKELEGSVRPELRPKVEKIAKALLTSNVAVSWNLSTAIRKLDLIPTTNVLPSDVNIHVDESTTNTDEIFSSIIEAEISAFKNAMAKVENNISFMNEENFSDRLHSLNRVKTVFEETKKEIKMATSWNEAAEILDKNLKTVEMSLDPTFMKNVSIGEGMLLYIEGRNAKGKSRHDLQTALHEISLDGSINKISNLVSKYAGFTDLHDGLASDKKVPRSSRDSFGNLFDLLSSKNLTLDSTTENAGKSRNYSTPFSKGQEGIFLPEHEVGLSNILTNTVYKVYLEEDDSCFLASVSQRYTLPCAAPPNFDKEVLIVCSPKDQTDVEKPGASWFFRYVAPFYYLFTLDKGNNNFLVLNVYGCDQVAEVAVFYMNEDSYETPPFKDTVTINKPNIIMLVNKDSSPWRYVGMSKFNALSTASLKYKYSQSEAIKFRFVPDLKLEAKVFKFEFDEPEPFTSSKKDFADTFQISNNGPTKITRKVTLVEAVTDEFSFGFSQGLSICEKVSATAKIDIPFIGGAEVGGELSTERTSGAHQDWKTSKTKTFEISYELEVPPNTFAKVSAWYEKVEDIKLAFTAEAEITGKGTKITKYNRVKKGERTSGGQIVAFLNAKGFEGLVLKVNDFSVLVQIDGELTASMGLRGNIDVESSSKGSD